MKQAIQALQDADKALQAAKQTNNAQKIGTAQKTYNTALTALVGMDLTKVDAGATK